MKTVQPSPSSPKPSLWTRLNGRYARYFVYKHYDSSAHWKKRASTCQGQARVLWGNEAYNQLFREKEREILLRFLPATSQKEWPVLDIGCGIGMVSRMLVEMHPCAKVDAVDFSEMIHVARAENAHERITYIESPAEEYINPSKKYGLILSSACFSSIRDIPRMERAISNAVGMLDDDGVLLMIDPLHTWAYLARVRYGSRDMVRLLKKHRCRLVYKSGVLFWPYRVFLMKPEHRPDVVRKKFQQGEFLLSCLGRHFWADYKILAFRKDP